jgi:hypothetical protein
MSNTIAIQEPAAAAIALATQAEVPATRTEVPATRTEVPATRAEEPATAKAPRGQRRDAWLYLGLTALVLAAWAFTRLGLYDSKSDVAYWLGVSGGVGMLLLLGYPMRKHLRFMRRMGPAKGWFVGHMVLGVTGPLLILLHSGFRIGSLNAGVAFYSMLSVAASGVIGRFLYLQLHRNLNGEKLTLGQMRAGLDASESAAARLRFAPKVVEQCHGFEGWALNRRTMTGLAVVHVAFVMPWRRWSVQRQCNAELRRRLVAVAHTEGWSRRKLEARVHAGRMMVRKYLVGAQRVALFSAWERLFSWWHIAHVPFVYILVISAIVHVVAVHAY